ncbi:MAG: class I SAM-dependent methyltransferase [Pikeienuella sp.]
MTQTTTAQDGHVGGEAANEALEMPERLHQLLRCPITGGPVHLSPSRDRSEGAPLCWSDAPAGERIEFPVVGGQPVLVNFADSVLSRAHVIATGARSLLASRVTRGTGRPFVWRLLFGENPVAAENAHRFVAALPPRSDGRAPLVLVIGGGTLGAGIAELREGGAEIVAFDVYASSHTDFIADAHAIPLADGVVDGVWIQAVLEHVLDPWRVADEIWRVLAPDGVVYAETPFLQPVHEGAYDFTRFTESGHRWLFRRFERLDSGVVTGPGTVLFQALLQCAWAVVPYRKLGTLMALPFFWLRFLDRLADPGYASDGASGTYFLGRRAVEALPPSEMPGAFRGAPMP